MGMIRLIPTANAGAVLWLGGLCIWTDVLNEANTKGYEVLSESDFDRLLNDPAFRPDAILFTHRHADHYSETRLFRAVETFPVYVGGADHTKKTVELNTDHGSAGLQIFPLPHDGAAYANVVNDALLLLSSAGNVLIPGDCPVACPELLEALQTALEKPENSRIPIDLAYLNFPWFSLGKGRKALPAFDPRHVLFCHLPAADKDIYGYKEQAERMLQKFGAGRDLRIVGKPFEEEYIF